MILYIQLREAHKGEIGEDKLGLGNRVLLLFLKYDIFMFCSLVFFVVYCLCKINCLATKPHLGVS